MYLHIHITSDEGPQKNQQYNMMLIGQQSTIAKPHLHVMLSQVGIKEGIRRF